MARTLMELTPYVKIINDPGDWDTGKVLRAVSVDYEFGVVKVISPDNQTGYYRWFDRGNWEFACSPMGCESITHKQHEGDL